MNAPTVEKSATPKAEKLPKGFKLPNRYKTLWFHRSKPAVQRAVMLAVKAGEDRKKAASKRDVETYAEAPKNSRQNSSNASVG